MENITITSCVHKPTKTGKNRWEATTTDGRTIGVWDEDLVARIMANLNKPANADIKVNGLYTNLNSIAYDQPEVAPVAPQGGSTVTTQPAGTPLPTMKKGIFLMEKDRSIARATIFNAAVQAVVSQVDYKLSEGDEEFGRELVHAINELTAAYQYVDLQVATL